MSTQVFRFGNRDKMIAEDEDNRRSILNFLNSDGENESGSFRHETLEKRDLRTNKI